MSEKFKIISWIKEDALRIKSLESASRLGFGEWCIGAGFVRNLVWDKLHEFSEFSPLNDLDLIYFDSSDLSEEKDLELEKHLRDITGFPWSVKNQARMHLRNKSAPYSSCSNAMSYWPEIETAVGAYLDGREVKLMCPFGVDELLSGSITRNPRCIDNMAFSSRLEKKGWLKVWPELRVSA
jgi:hypothetical protein